LSPDAIAGLIALASAVVGTLAALGGWLRGPLARRRMRRRFERGVRGQEHARTLLERWGFEVLAAEPVFKGEVEVDGEARPISIRPDFMVQRAGELAVVEVKTGERAGDPCLRSTRRQLREYAALIPADMLYLLDAEAEALIRVHFPESELRRGDQGVRWAQFSFGIAVGLALAALWAWV